jgi:hypothetical protein
LTISGRSLKGASINPLSFGTQVTDSGDVSWTIFQCVTSYSPTQAVVHTALLYKADGTCKVDDLSDYVISP